MALLRSYHGLYLLVMASLILQMALYFNAYFSPVWFLFQMSFLFYKFHLLTQLYKFLLTTALIVLTPLEVMRLYLGYIGNLSDKVPELAGFWLLTLLLQCPLQSWLTFNNGSLHFPVEKIVDAIMLIFIAVEVFAGFIALKTISREQARKFKMHSLIEQHSQSVETLS